MPLDKHKEQKTEAFTMVWLKRDLRLRDHEAIFNAINLGQKLVIAYVIEPWQQKDQHFDLRHWRFIFQSLVDLNEQLAEFDAQVTVCRSDIIDLLSACHKQGLTHIYSHQEIGLQDSFSRDLKVSKFCKEKNITWHECVYGAVQRPLPNRIKWRSHWRSRINNNIFDPDYRTANFYEGPLPYSTPLAELPQAWQQADAKFQAGGEKRAWYTLKDFFKTRGKAYFGNIGKPAQARHTCSRLSPYLAWGNISIKQVYQYSQKQAQREGWKASVRAFQSRLSWHCHFIQKFESEHQMEFRAVNKAYLDYPYDTSIESEQKLDAWKQGKTGFPIIDASMLALIHTGYLNFRMRAMLVSFLCHHLNIDWKRGAGYLGSMFLDFEPGIHYPQFQMQAGVTGTNTIRLYNPVKQSLEKDPEAEFILKWLPKLSVLPRSLIHQPWLLGPLDAVMFDFDVDRDYCHPIIDLKMAAKQARDRLWTYRKREDVKIEANRILHTHSVMN